MLFITDCNFFFVMLSVYSPKAGQRVDLKDPQLFAADTGRLHVQGI